MNKPNSLLAAATAFLIGAAIGYHARPRIVRITGGDGDEAVILARLEGCEEKLNKINQELRHARQLNEVYQELNARRKSS